MKPVPRTKSGHENGKNSENISSTNSANEKVGRKCMKMRRYRNNVKNDPERLERMREKDRERKRLQRQQQRQKIQAGNRQLEEHVKSQQRKYTNKYRQKKKGNEKSVETLPSKSKKHEAVLRTQRWRLRVKLVDQGNTHDKSSESIRSQSNELEQNETSGPSTSKSSEYNR